MVSVPNLVLKVIFFLHLFLTVWPLIEFWSPYAYMYYNLLFLLMLLWGIHLKESEEPIFMALVINFGAILLDIIILALRFPPTFTFCAGMCILNLILRPVTCIYLLRLFNERGGRYSDLGIPTFGGGAVGGTRGQYDDIDQPTTQSVPKTGIDTGSPGHGFAGDPTGGPPPYGYPQP
ncbi:type-1 angiotensin II receptor-associated protein-like [Ornithodoros turicata]|uniref:type-1 angiotensin II receptor-associated protein-like n=1 Tax=Ornithodoros turicata TaxID=34597 RepID=UPI0031395CC2